MSPLILDSDAISTLARDRRGAKFQTCLTYLKAALDEDALVLVPAAVLQEQYRGARHDQSIDAFLSRHRGAIEVVPTTRELARQAGHLQGKHKLDSSHSTDAVVVAVAAMHKGTVLTSDPDDMRRLASGIPGVVVVDISSAS